MNRIKILPLEIVTKIAAGEVIERPASVVKELLENSFDANAANITVEIKKSGKELITVMDDGTGMSREDAAVAVERHSTSKITDIADLENITTFGFRGEALPSISSISDLKITTKTESENIGTAIETANSKILGKKDAAMPRGTTVTVSNLFKNIPARLKFMKSDLTEKNKIISFVTEYAIANFQISLRFISDGKELFFYTAANDLKTRLAQIFGTEFPGELLFLEAKHENISLSGYISKPGKTFLSRNRIFTFINKRPVSSRTIFSAVKNGYGEFLKSKENPAVFLLISVDPASIDVNVHPTKREIKFKDEEAIYSIIFQMVRSRLLTNDAIPQISGYNQSEAKPSTEYPQQISSRNENINSAKTEYVVQEFTKKNAFQPKYIGRIFELYIVAEYEGELLIVDQHAAQEKILYEKFKKDLNDKTLKIQNLLIPVNIDLPPKEFSILADLKDELGKIGFEIEEFGKNSFIIKTVPDTFDNISVISVISDIILKKKVGGLSETSEKLIDDITQSACKTAVKAGDKLSEAETVKLLEELLGCENPYTCPHGRPTMIKLSKDELDRRFLRK